MLQGGDAWLWATAARQVAALAVDIDRHVPPQLRHVLLAQTRADALTDEQRHDPRLAASEVTSSLVPGRRRPLVASHVFRHPRTFPVEGGTELVGGATYRRPSRQAQTERLRM